MTYYQGANITGGDAIAGSYLGSIFWWKLPRGPVKRDAVEAAFEARFGAGHSILRLIPAAPEPSVVFKRCAASLREGGRYDARRIEATAQEVSFAVAEVGTDQGAKKATYRHETTVTWTADPAGGPGTITWTGSGTAGAATLVSNYVAGLDALGAQEFTELGSALVSAFRAIPLRKSGGVYWLRQGTFTGDLTVAAAAWRATGGKMFLTPQFGTAEGEQALGDAAKGGVLADLLALAEEIKGFDQKTRATTLDARLCALKDLKERANFACSLLNESAESIVNAIQPLERAIVSALLGNDGATDAIDLSTYEQMEAAF